MELLRFLAIGLAAGWIMGKIRRGRGYGVFGNLAIGAIGSIIGWFFMGFLMIQPPNLLAQIAMAVAGAIVFFLLVGALKWKSTGKSKEAE